MTFFLILCKIFVEFILNFLFFCVPQMTNNFTILQDPVDMLLFTFLPTIPKSSDGILVIQNKPNLAILTFEYCVIKNTIP